MPAENPKVFLRKMILSSGILAAFAIAGVATVALVHEQTKERILENERQTLVATLNEVLPASEYDNDLLADRVMLQDKELLGSSSPLPAFRARRNGDVIAVLMEVIAPNGYSGNIKLLVGIRADGTITAVRVLSHKETPGLGDAIEAEKSDWLEQFPGKSLQQSDMKNWKVARDGGSFDQLTGATITPRAVVEALRNALIYFREHKQEIISRPSSEAPGPAAGMEETA